MHNIERFSDLRQALETMMQRIETGEDIMEQLKQIDALSQELAPTAPKMLLDKYSSTHPAFYVEREDPSFLPRNLAHLGMLLKPTFWPKREHGLYVYV